MIFSFSPTNFNPNKISLVFYETGDATRNCTGELKYTLPLLFKGEELILTKIE